MKNSRSKFLVILLAALALTVVGCGNADEGAYLGTPGAPVDFVFSDSDSATPVTTNRTKLGVIVAGQALRTLYTFQTEDGKPIECRGECVSTWLPVIVGKAGIAISGDIDKSKVGAVEFSNKANQMSYAGHPLYFYAHDEGDSSVAGAGKDSYGAKWFALGAGGELKK